jgi:nucleoid-associated protein YgaU
MKQIITKILPIIIIFFLIVHSRQTIEFSHSILGRLFAVSIIVFYIKCDILYGLLACLLVIFYYQSDFVEQYNNENDKIKLINLEGFNEIVSEKPMTSQQIKQQAEADKAKAESEKVMAEAEKAKAEAKIADAEAEKAKAEAKTANTEADIAKVEAQADKAKAETEKAKAKAEKAKIEEDKINDTISTNTNEVFTNYNELYPEVNSNMNDHMKNDHSVDVKKYFKEQNCNKGLLKFKNISVKNEIAPHIFPELQYLDKPCNPCSDSCNYSIIEEKMKTEEELVKPKNSNDIVSYVISLLFPTKINATPAIGVVSEPFSKYK